MFNLRKVSYVDSSGLAVFIELFQKNQTVSRQTCSLQPCRRHSKRFWNCKNWISSFTWPKRKKKRSRRQI